jgi:SAM-dependent methyltransferase
MYYRTQPNPDAALKVMTETIADGDVTYAETTPADSQSFTPYDQWGAPGGQYTEDVRSWGYIAPEKCVEALAAAADINALAAAGTLRLFDAGCGDGLVAPIFRRAFVSVPTVHITGFDLSQGMLDGAKSAGGYDALQQGSLDEKLPYEDDSFEAVAVVGTTSYIAASGCCMSEWCRVTAKGGLVVFTIRGPYDTVAPYYEESGWKAAMAELVEGGKWVPVSESEDIPYLPDHPDFGATGSASLACCRVFVFRVCA